MSALVEGALIAGKYRLEYLIGRGGMGSVWAAHHLQLDTKVALKFIDPLADAGDARARFEREARAAAQLRSPHVVQILDHGVDGDQPYIAMELLEGEDLGERLRREKRLSIKAMATILTQAAKALRRAHDAGVIHRDLKPSNIFLARFDDDEVVKILDFGVAKIRNPGIDTGSEFTQTGVIFGSPAYMSPEQARGAKLIDHRSDLWSLAVIVFRAITGEKPFEAASIGDLVIKLCIDPLPVASSFAPDLSPEIDAFFFKAFAREVDQRFPSAVAMAAELSAIAARSAAPLPAPLPPPPPLSSPSALAAHDPEPAPESFTNPRMSGPQPYVPGPAPLPPPPLPSVTPQPPSRTPSPSMRTVTATSSADQKRVVLWGAIGGSALALIVLLAIVSGHRSTGDATSAATSSPVATPSPPRPPPEAPTTTAAAAPTPEPSAAPPPEPSALPEAQGTAAPSAAPSARPKGAGGKTGKGRVPNFGY